MSIVTLPLAARLARQLFRAVLYIIGAILVAFALKMPAGADESRTLIIPPNDGYGFEECLTPGTQCGLVVADAWCKAHGFAESKGFAPVGEANGAMDGPPGSVHVTCGGHLN
jgi:hypothetical protein